MLAPIVVFCYNRLEELDRMFSSLKNNPLSSDSDLIIYCDGPKNTLDKIKTDEIRDFVRSISGFKSISIHENDRNRGLAPSIIAGVSEVLEKYGSAIVIEDDLILSHNFLNWMNQCLEVYYDNEDVFSVSGFTPSILKAYNNNVPDVLFTMKAHSWGWATWKNRWDQVDWELTDWNEFSHNKQLQRDFATIGVEMPELLFRYKEGKTSTWWARFCYTQFKLKRYTVYPVLSKVINSGFTEESTNCRVYNRFRVDFDNTNKQFFNLPSSIVINEVASRRFYYYYSWRFRVVGKIKTILLRVGIIRQYTVKI